MDFIERLDLLKKQKGVNNSTLAKGAGIPYTTIDGLYKKGYANVKLSTLKALCRFFGVTLDYLVKGTEEEAPQPEQQTEAPDIATVYTSAGIAARVDRSGRSSDWQRMVEAAYREQSQQLSEQERQLITEFRKLTDEQRQKLMALLEVI